MTITSIKITNIPYIPGYPPLDYMKFIYKRKGGKIEFVSFQKDDVLQIGTKQQCNNGDKDITIEVAQNMINNNIAVDVS